MWVPSAYMRLVCLTCLAVSFLSIIPLAKLLAFATDELSLRVGQTLAGLLNATLVRIVYSEMCHHLTAIARVMRACPPIHLLR